MCTRVSAPCRRQQLLRVAEGIAAGTNLVSAGLVARLRAAAARVAIGDAPVPIAVLMGCVVGVLVHTHHPAATCWPLTAGTWTAP